MKLPLQKIKNPLSQINPFTRILGQNITSRKEKDNEAFLSQQDSKEHTLTRVVSDKCKPPTNYNPTHATTGLVFKRVEKKKRNVSRDELKELLLKQNAASKQFRLTKIQVADPKHVENTAFRRNQVVKSKSDEDEILSLIKLHNTKPLQKNNADLVSMLKNHNHSVRKR